MKKIYLNKEKKQALPYALNGLKVKNFQGIIDLEIDELPCDAQWIFLVGENGFGKTSVLRAIAEKLTETSVDLTFLRAILDHIKEIWYFCNRTNDFKKYKNEILPAVGYGISRFNMSINIKADINPFASLFQENAVLESIEQEIKDWHYDGHQTRYIGICKLLCDLMPAIDSITVEYDKETDKKQVFYHEKNADGSLYDPVTFDKLATGYRNIIAMVGDMLLRLRRNQHESIDRENYKDYEGIVLIDEFDAHLHPKYQYELPKLLSSVFPKVQFIVSTHSPIPLLGAPKDSSVVLNVNRTKAEGITLERMDEKIPINHLQPNALLTSPIFGFETLFARDATPDTVSPFSDFEKIKEMDELEQLILLKNGLKKQNINSI